MAEEEEYQTLEDVDNERLKIQVLKHYELPKSEEWSMPRISSNNTYMAAKCQTVDGKEEAYIWKKSNKFSPRYLYKYTVDKVLDIQFAPNSKSFIVCYVLGGATYVTHINIASGKPIVDCIKEEEQPNLYFDEVLTSCFSEQSRYYGIGTKDYIMVWDVLKGKIKIGIEESSEIKSFREDYVCTVTKDLMVHRFKITEKDEEKINKPFIQLTSVASDPSEIKGFALGPSKKDIFFGTSNAIYKLNLEDPDECEQYKLNTPCEKILFSDDCKHFVTTDFKSWNYWKWGDKKPEMAKRQPFSDIKVCFDSDLVLTIDSVSLIAQNVKKVEGKEINIKNIFMNIFLDSNPGAQVRLILSKEQNYLAVIYDDVKGALYEAESRQCLYKWPRIAEEDLENLKLEGDEFKF
ncbi:MAG: WD40 repeat domain-containing protein [archaeon]|nr:WD40 repeat domain-containing protein [archaeon]